MTCEEARVNMHFHLDGEDYPHVQKAREHTASCVHCGQFYSDLLEVEQNLRSLPRYSAPPALMKNVLDAITGLTQKQPQGRMRLS